ncbi:MAG TPA: cytochrome c biogenesis protein CcsA [Thermoflexia bacterium]|nr:cytochrome c biogenesis protein CcsA [Thermoflexia bacterium]
MLAEVGSILTALALTVALYAACAAFWAIRQSDSRWEQSARNGVYATTGLLGLAFLILLAAFLDDQFQIRYVAEHSSRALPLYLKISAVWAGQEGSLLMWAFLQALFAALVVARPSDRTRPLLPWATVFLSLITTFFTGVTLFLSNPFAQMATAPADGQGMNPLLRHPGMIFHPPAMYLGYVGLAVPFAFALAALITRRIEDWPAASRRWTLAAWLFLGIGLLLGMRWAYDVLGWGGYWGWDPVENAGLLPWFTATALLHSAVMQEQRGGFRWWNLLLAVFSFTLVLFGTFTTRSGMIQSVHAFARSNLGPYFLAAIGLTLASSLALMINRRSTLADPRPVERLLSRDGMFFLTLLLFVTLTVSVFIGSVLPTITEVLTNQRFEAGPDWFDRVTGPQFAALVLVMGVCPLLGQAAAALARLQRRGWLSVLGAVLVVGAAALAGFTGWIPLIGLGIIGLAGATTLAEYARDASALSRRQGINPLQALWTLLGRNRRKYGGYLVHTGVILMAAGIVGTRMYPFETTEVLSLDEATDVGEYTLVYDDFTQEAGADHLNTQAALSLYRGDNLLATLRPRMEQYVNFADQTASVPALRVGLREDFYVVLSGWSDGGQAATFKVFVNSLAVFLWVGGLVFLAGGTAALWPSTRSARLSAPQARRRTAGTAIGVAVGLLVLTAAGVAMWGGTSGQIASEQGTSEQVTSEQEASEQTKRPRVGEAAPDFTLNLLDGSTLSLADLGGEIVVINFWTTWCAPCEDELPDFQTVWDEYQDQDVTFVGIAIQEEEDEVQKMLSRLDITYPQGVDPNQRVAFAYGITGVPETFVVNAEGNVAYISIGPVSAEELGTELDRLLNQ